MPPRRLERITEILAALDGRDPIDKLSASPSFRLHQLKGKRKGEWAVRVSGNWRITFRFEGGEAYDIDLIDYH